MNWDFAIEFGGFAELVLLWQSCGGAGGMGGCEGEGGGFGGGESSAGARAIVAIHH